MGLFLQMGAVTAPAEDTRDALRRIAPDLSIELVPGNDGKTLVMFPEYADGVSETCRKASDELSCPVFYLHVHDGDLWLYELFDCGHDVDRFNTDPDYWGEISAAERSRWQGNPEVIAQVWPEIEEGDVRRYLVDHSRGDFDPDAKAYATDKFSYWDCWQLSDFMAKLGVPYPDSESQDATSQDRRRGSRLLFDRDVAILIGLGVYGMVTSPSLLPALRVPGFALGALLGVAGVGGMFRQRWAAFAAAAALFLLIPYGLWQVVAKGASLVRIVIVAGGAYGCWYFLSNRDRWNG